MANRYWVGGSSTWGNTANWSATSGGAGGASVPGTGDDAFFDRAGTFSITIANSTVATCRNLTISAGTVTINIGTSTTGATFSIYGNIDFTGGAGTITVPSTNNTLNIGLNATATSTFITIKSNGGTITGSPLNLGGKASGTIQLLDNFSSGTITYVGGTSHTLDLNNFSCICQSFISTATSARTIAFGTGNITVTGAGATAMNVTSTGLTVTGTPVVYFTTAGTTATTVVADFLASFYFTAGNYSLTWNPYSVGVNTIDFTGHSGAWGRNATNVPIYGNLNISSGLTVSVTTGSFIFSATSGIQTLTTNGRTINFPITQNGTGGTLFLADALTLGSTALTLNSGTFDGNNKTISGASSFTMSGTVSIANISTSLAFTHTSGSLTLSGNCTFGAYTFTAGSITL